MIFCCKGESSFKNIWFVRVWYNPEEILGAKSATESFGELSVFSELLRKT